MIRRVSGGVPFEWLVLLAAAGCSSSTAPQVLPDINGAWAYNETTTSGYGSAGTEACSLTGTITFTQDSLTFVGTYNRTSSCSTADTRTATTTEAGSIPRGVITEHGLTFRIGDCQYQAGVLDSLPNRLTGNTLCTEVDPVTLTAHGVAGSWLADRLQR